MQNLYFIFQTDKIVYSSKCLKLIESTKKEYLPYLEYSASALMRKFGCCLKTTSIVFKLTSNEKKQRLWTESVLLFLASHGYHVDIQENMQGTGLVTCLKECEQLLDISALHRLKKEDREALLLIWHNLELCNCMFKVHPVHVERELGQSLCGTVYLMRYSLTSPEMIAVKSFNTSMPPFEIASEVYHTK